MDEQAKFKLAITFLSNGWADAIHKLDSATQALQLLPDWPSKVQEALNNPLRRQHSQEKIDYITRAVNQILESQGDAREIGSQLEQSLREFLKPPN